MNADIQTILPHLERVTGPDAQGWYTARCPAHDDRKPSLRLREGNNGRPIVKCHAGCSSDAVFRALGLESAQPSKSDSNGHRRDAEPQASYDYRDGANRLLYQVVRYPDKNFRQRRPDGNGDWMWNLEGVRRVPYRLPELLGAPKDAWVFIAEGEKDADRLASLGLVATTNSGGAGKWPREFGPYFEGRLVAIIPDNDPPGRAHAQVVAQSAAQNASVVKVVNLPGLAEKGDVSDWFDLGHVAEELLALVEEAPEFDSSTIYTAPRGRNEFLSARELCEEEEPSIEWVWQGFLSRGDVTLMAARPKIGKTTAAYHLVQALANRQPFLGLETQPTSVMILSEEKRGRVRSRLEALGLAEREDVYVMFRSKDTPPWSELLDRIKPFMLEHGVCLLVVDTVDKFWPGKLKDADVALGYCIPTVDLARELNVAILLLHHRRKEEGEEGTAVSFSHAITGAVDIIIEMQKDRNHSQRRILQSLSRYEETPESLIAELTEDGYLALGDKQTVSKADTEARFFEVMPLPDEEPLGVDAILAGMEDPKPGKAKSYEILTALLEKGKVERHGQGKKGDPYLWRRAEFVSSTMADVYGGRNEFGGNGHKPALVEAALAMGATLEADTTRGIVVALGR